MDAGAARGAIEAAVTRFVTLVRPVDPTTRVRGSDWTVAQVAAHLLTPATVYEGYLRGDTEPVAHIGHVNEDNARNLASAGPIDLPEVLDRIERGTTSFLAATAGLAPDHEMRWHDVTSTLGTVYGIYLAEYLLHGRDIARTLRRPWPISRSDATVIIESAIEVGKLFVDPQRSPDATFQLRVRGGPAYTLRFENGELDVSPGRPARADCRISGDPRALVLVLYKRRSQWTEIATGRLFAGGPKPWLGISFGTRFSGF